MILHLFLFFMNLFIYESIHYFYNFTYYDDSIIGWYKYIKHVKKIIWPTNILLLLSNFIKPVV